MTAAQFDSRVNKLLESFKRKVEDTSDQKKVQMLRKHLREERGLIFVNAKPYFRVWKPFNRRNS